MIVVFEGLPGCGKSSIAREVAKKIQNCVVMPEVSELAAAKGFEVADRASIGTETWFLTQYYTRGTEAKSLREAIRDADLVGESVKIEVAGDVLKMSAVGDVGSVFSEWQRGADELLELKAEGDGGATFTLSYLNKIVDAAVVSSEVTALELSTDMPLRMDFELPKGRLVYYLAPCIGA
jgi:hypothetical protein